MFTESLQNEKMSSVVNAVDVCERVLHQLEGYLSTRGFGTQAMHDVDKALDRILQGSGLSALENYIESQVIHGAQSEHPGIFRARTALEQEFFSASIARASIRKINEIIETCAANAQEKTGW